MGSILAASVPGFLCRLCSEMHRCVIHIYGEVGLQMQIARKINEYLPINITPSDALPKTICDTCLMRVEQHHSLMMMLERNSARFRKLFPEGSECRRRRLQQAAAATSDTAETPASGAANSEQTQATTVEELSSDDDDDDDVVDAEPTPP